jgi:PAS domain-containing protein
MVYPPGNPILQRRLSDLLAAYQFSEVQLIVLQEQAGVHHTRNVALRLASLHRRMDAIEDDLRKRAKTLGQDSTLGVAELCQRLTSQTDRRGSNNGSHSTERRLWVRRENDQHRLIQSAASTDDAAPRWRPPVRRLLDRFDDVVLLGSARWDCLAGNQAAVRMLGYGPDQLFSMSLYSLIAPPDAASAANGSDWEWPRPLLLRSSDGSVARMHARVRSVRLSYGKVNVLVGRQLQRRLRGRTFTGG